MGGLRAPWASASRERREVKSKNLPKLWVSGACHRGNAWSHDGGRRWSRVARAAQGPRNGLGISGDRGGARGAPCPVGTGLRADSPAAAGRAYGFAPRGGGPGRARRSWEGTAGDRGRPESRKAEWFQRCGDMAEGEVLPLCLLRWKNLLASWTCNLALTRCHRGGCRLTAPQRAGRVHLLSATT